MLCYDEGLVCPACYSGQWLNIWLYPPEGNERLKQLNVCVHVHNTHTHALTSSLLCLTLVRVVSSTGKSV